MQRLIDQLPGVSVQTLAEIICGYLVGRFDCPISYFQTLRALIIHAGTKGNRVWPSYARLVAVVNKTLKDAGSAGSIGWKTAKRGVQYWRQKIGLRIIVEQEELLAGPGEHDYVESGKKKQSEYAVNHYDLSALQTAIPTDLVDILDLLVKVSEYNYNPPALPPAEPPRDVDARYPDPSTEENAQLSLLDLPASDSEDLPEDLRFNPFEDEPVSAPPFPATSLQETLHSTPSSPRETICSVSINTASESRKNPPGEAAGPPKFHGTNLAATRKRYPRAREGQPKPQGRQALSQSSKQPQRQPQPPRLLDVPKVDVNPHAPGYQALAKAGVHAGMRREIVRARGDSWAWEVALYARIMEERGAIEQDKAKYIVGVFQSEQADRAAKLRTVWPDWFQDRIKRERAAEAQVVRDQEVREREEGDSRRIVHAPDLPNLLPKPVFFSNLPGVANTLSAPEPTTAPTVPPAVVDPLASLSEAERAALRDEAWTELRKSMSGAKDKLLAAFVDKRMRVIYEREKGKGVSNG